MESIFTELNIIDVIVVVLTILMGIKGTINGFYKELLGFIGLIGGVFVASRIAGWMGRQMHASIIQINSVALLELISFLIALALLWGATVLVGNIIANTPKDKSYSTVSRIFGFVLAGLKYFFIFSLIVSTLFKTPLITENMSKTIKESRLYPLLNKTGSIIINMSSIDDKQEYF